MVLAAVEPGVDSDARDLVLSPVTRILRAIIPTVAANAMLAAESIIALIPRLIRPSLNSVAMLQVILPHALILRSIHVLVNTAAISLVICPVAIIDVAIDVDETTLAMGSVLSPLSAVLGPIVPSLLAKPITEATLPFTCVDGTRFESVGGALLPLLVWPIQVLCDRLASLFLREILAASELLGPEH